MQKDKKNSPNFRVTINQKLLTSSYPITETPEAYFPYQPYPEQSQVIQTLHQAITTSQNALIESPTGTGKTLCLLVGSLSALKVLRQKSIKIFYLTRTHSQISQVIDEIKKTCYNVKVNIIASRDHFCVNPNTKDMKGRVLEKACNDMVSNKTCWFKEGDKRPHIRQGPISLEEFRDECRKELVCPFFHSRELTERSEITILPFNYFLDWRIFQTFAHLIKESVIIFDEAHNVDSVAEEGGNLEIDCKQLSFAINELRQLQKKFKFQNETNSKNKSQIKKAQMIFERLKNSIEQTRHKVFLSKSELEEFMEKSTTIANPQSPQETISGLEMSDSLVFFQDFNQVSKLFYKKQMSPSNFSNVVACLDKMCHLYRAERFEKEFVVKVVSNEEEKQCGLRLKCLSPSIGFEKLKSYQPRSIILSSGTLGNLYNWQRYLSMQFHKKLSISSFITKNQLFASIVPRSQTGYSFEFSYQKKDYENQHREVAEELKHIEDTIPSGNGIVVAFSTYLLMEKVVRNCGILKKKVFYESKGSDVVRTFSEYSEVARKEGAFLFIVMKGRFSEGINFTDYLCRCLVVVGIPFLPRKETNVEEKLEYLKQNFSNEDSQNWYMEQTFQAVNQTIGRAIRSKKDYGVILLLDQRYLKKQNFQLLSEWFKRNSTKPQIDILYSEIQQFFATETWKASLQVQDLKENKINQLPSVKTVKAAHNKKHLKLKFDSQEKIKPSKSKTVSSNKTISRSSKPKLKKGNQLSDKKSYNGRQCGQELFQTPKKSPKKPSNSASIVLSKINMEKKHKLKGFINGKLKIGARKNFMDYQTSTKSRSVQKEKTEKIEDKKVEDGKKEENVQIDAYLEFFMM